MSEFKKELEKNMELDKVFHERESFDSDFLVSKHDIERIFEDWQPPKALPEVPQCVDYAIRSLYDGIRGAFDVIYLIKCTVEQEKRYTPNWVEVYEWIFEYGNSAIFERAFLDGYTVEKPKEILYFVKLPGVPALDAYLCKSCSPGEIGYHEVYSSKEPNKISFSSRYDKQYSGGWQRQFTESEIKTIDERYWAFAVPVEEAQK